MTVVKLGPLANQIISGPKLVGGGGVVYFIDLNGDLYGDLLGPGAYYPNEGKNPVDRPGLLVFGGPEGWSAADAGVFPAASMLTVHVREVAVADFNGDKTPDLFIADHGYDAAPFPGHVNGLFMSDGNGAWRNASGTLPTIPDFTHSVTVGDVDRDGDLDIFAGNNLLRDAYFLINDGKGGFSKQTQLLPINSPASDQDAAKYTSILSSLLVDLDQDGWLDLVISSPHSDQARQVLWSNRGSFAAGEFTSLPRAASLGTAYDVIDVQSTDVNLDGRPDLLVSTQTQTNGGWDLAILINKGGRVFENQTAKFLARPETASGGFTDREVAPSLWFLEPHDFNNDGRMDYFTSPVAVRPQQPRAELPVFLIQGEDGRFDSVTVGDLVAGGLDTRFFNGLQIQQRGAPDAWAFSHNYFMSDGSAWIDSHTITFAAPSSHWQAGTSQADVLTGGSGVDWMAGHAGNDSLNGGAGIDLAWYSAERRSAAIARTDRGWTVSSGEDGRDSLEGIERLRFADMRVALDFDSDGQVNQGRAAITAKTVHALLGPSFVSDRALVGAVIGLLDGGLTYGGLVGAIVSHPAFNTLAGAASGPLSVEGFVAHLYKNVVHSVADTATVSLLANLIVSGSMTSAEFAMFACESGINAASVGLVGLAASGIEYIPS